MTTTKEVIKEYLRDDPGHPLGRGMPMGRTLRQDGESHLQAWERLLRHDLCSYCGKPPTERDPHWRNSVDHIEPKNPRTPLRGVGSKYGWNNLTAACVRCNCSKSDKPLWYFLWLRR